MQDRTLTEMEPGRAPAWFCRLLASGLGVFGNRGSPAIVKCRDSGAAAPARRSILGRHPHRAAAFDDVVAVDDAGEVSTFLSITSTD
jgi:hypothetical protein